MGTISTARCPYSARVMTWKDAVRQQDMLRDAVASQGGRASLLIHPGNLIGKPWGERSPLNQSPFSAEMNLYMERIRQAVSQESGVCFILGGNHPFIGKQLNVSELEPAYKGLWKQHYNSRYPHTYSLYAHHAAKLTEDELAKRDDLMVKALIVDIPSVTNEGMPFLAEQGLLHFRDPARWDPVISYFRQIGVASIDFFGGEEATYGEYNVEGEKKLNERLGDGMGCPGAALFSLRQHYPIRVYPQLCFGTLNGHVSSDAPLDKDAYMTGTTC